MFKKSYDVLVLGAGMAGVAAAVSAAKEGMRVALIEKTVFPGGLATTGNVSAYLPLCDGLGRKVTGGLAESFLNASIKMGPGRIPSDWRIPQSVSRLTTFFNPDAMILTLDSVLSTAGVDFWLDTLVTKPVMEGLRLRGVRVENKSGSGRLDAHCLIDCTGDADVAFRAGAPCGYGENRLVIWAYQVSMERARQCVARNDASHLLKMTVRQRPNPPRGEAGTGRDDPFGGKAVSQFVLESRSLLRDYYVKRQRSSGKNRVYPIRLPGLPHFRTSRRIEGLYTLGAADAWMQHKDTVGLMADWRGTGGRQNDVWELPYRCLLPQRVSGLLVAGRCISSDGDAWEITRAIGSVVLQGEVAGVAAALSVQNSCLPRALDPRAIRKVLGKRGVPCGLAEIYSADEMEKNRPKGKNA